MAVTPISMIILAVYELPVGMLPKVLPLLREVQQFSQGESGCISYQVSQDVACPNKIYLYEIYRDEAALHEHRDSKHFKDIVMAQIIPLLTSRTVTQLNPII